MTTEKGRRQREEGGAARAREATAPYDAPPRDIVAELVERIESDPVLRARLGALLGVPVGLPEALNRLADELREQRLQADRRFEAIDRRFEAIDRHFEAIDRHFEALQHEMDRRFEAVDRRFEALQREMDRRFDEFAAALRGVRQEVGRLADNLGFGLEEIARLMLPGYLERHAGIRVYDLDRRFFDAEPEPLEINVYGEGTRDGSPVAVVVEVKAKIYRREAADFLALLDRLRPRIPIAVVPVMFGYMVHPSAEEAAAPHGVLLVSAYQTRERTRPQDA